LKKAGDEDGGWSSGRRFGSALKSKTDLAPTIPLDPCQASLWRFSKQGGWYRQENTLLSCIILTAFTM
jgi:hypothetical protein